MYTWIELLERIITIFIIVGIPIYILNYIKNKKNQNTQTTQSIIQTPIEKETEHSKEYQRKYLLTKNEWYEWQKLKRYCDEKEYLIAPKVRLLDLIEPYSGSGYMSRLGKIQSKHVDFVICNSKMYVIGIIELDDNSHNKTDRAERDLFVDSVLKSAGYKVHRTKSITEYTLDFLSKKNEQSTPDEQNQP